MGQKTFLSVANSTLFCIDLIALIPLLGGALQLQKKRCGRVVRAAQLWCRKSCKVVSREAGLCHVTTVDPAVNGYLFQIREG